MVVWLGSWTVSWKAVGSIPITHSGIFQSKVGSYPEWARYGPNGKSEVTWSDLIHFTDVPVRVLLGRERWCPHLHYMCLLILGLVDAGYHKKKKKF